MSSNSKYLALLRFPGFQPFLYTQFLGAFNDNLFKMVISLFAVNSGSLSHHESGYLPMVGAVFILPFLLFSGYAGHLSDRFNKRTVIIGTKSTEIIAALIGYIVLSSGKVEWMLLALFLMALHSAFFSPAKYGILPEMLPPEELSRANGLLEMSTFLAIILGTSMGGILFAWFKNNPEKIGLILIVIALAGTLFSFGTGKVPSPPAKPPFRWNPWSETVTGSRKLILHSQLGIAVLFISLFWFFGALLQMDIILYGKEVMALDDLKIGLSGGFLALGIGSGSLLAGYLSGNKIELGLVPVGLFGLALFSLLLSLSGFSYLFLAAVLVLLGGAGGLFIVPLNAFLQQMSPPAEKGRLLATNNFYNMGGVLLASGVLWFLRDFLQIHPGEILMIFGILLLGAAYLLLTRSPDYLVRSKEFVRTLFQTRIFKK
jgi:acyl-[acyl-carrier-protein]-phospholipid O-acyltransferase/long-chain-fatty-acid--[acyl-carrier-protein] ligase